MANHVEASGFAPTPGRSILSFVWGAAATLLSVVYTAVLVFPAAIFGRLGMPHAATKVSTLWARLIMRTCGVKLEIQGLENLNGLRSYTLVANHQSFFDIFAIVGYMPGEVRFVAKRELMKIPMVGYAMRQAGHIIIDRQSGGKEVRKAIEIARDGFSIVVFAEGHRSTDNQVHEFNDGGAWIAILTKTPAVPMSISGSGSFFPRRAIVPIPGGRMRMTIGKPISTEGMKSADRVELTRKLEEAVRATFAKEV